MNRLLRYHPSLSLTKLFESMLHHIPSLHLVYMYSIYAHILDTQIGNKSVSLQWNVCVMPKWELHWTMWNPAISTLFFFAARLFIGQWDSAMNPTCGNAKRWIAQHRSLGLIIGTFGKHPWGFSTSKNCWFQWRFQICFSIVTNQTPKRMYTHIGVWYIKHV